MNQLETPPDLTLDPTDWGVAGETAHHVLSTILERLESIREQPVWKPVPDEVRMLLKEPLPLEGMPFERVVADIRDSISAYPAGHAHPRFWGWVCGTGTPICMIADMVSSGINASSGTFNDASSRVEDQVIAWMRELFVLPEGASGIITSGSSIANLIGLAVARDSRIEMTDVPAAGLSGLPHRPIVYASNQVHSSIDKAMKLLGLGEGNLRKVSVDDRYRLDLNALRATIQDDRTRGHLPIALVVSAGTVNTGAIDDLEGAAAIAKEEDLWFHVDGAIGALAVISPNLRPKLRGIDRADSIALDFHKWLYVPYEAGCIMIRDGERHRKTFATSASYLEAPPRGVGARSDPANDRGPQLSRNFKALKVWAQLREHGLKKLGKMMDQNVEQIRYLSHLIGGDPELEQLAPAEMNILCFRYRVDGESDENLNSLNLELLMRLQESGIAVPSGTQLRGRFALRVANTNQRSRREDFELLAREVTRLGRKLARQ